MRLTVALVLSYISLFTVGAAVGDEGCGHTVEYLIICEDEYLNASNIHANRLRYNPVHYPLNVCVYTLSHIAITYGDADTVAIRSAITDLWDAYGCFKYVLLVGENIPSYYFVPRKAPLKRWHSQIAYDDPYGDVDSDGQLEVVVGRVCSSSPGEFVAWSDKVRELMLMDPDDPFHKEVLVLAEDGMINDEDGDYVRQWGTWLAEERLPWYLAEKTVVYAREVDPYLDPQTLQDYILPIFNEGYGIVIGIGTYSSPFDFVDFFSTDYANFTPEMLSNYGKYPVVLGFCCEVARWDTVAQHGKIMNLMNFADSTGSVLWIGPSAMTLQAQSKAFLDEVFERIFYSDQFQTWGQAFVDAKNQLLARMSLEREIWWEYSLFGEPSLPLNCGVGEPARVAGSSEESRCELMIAANPSHRIGARLMLSSTGIVNCKIKVYDVRGRLVKQVFAGIVEPGVTVIEWDCRESAGRKVSPGIYLVCLEYGSQASVKKLVLLK